MAALVPLIAGLLFGIGLVISGMGDPAKVLNFLDIAGAWDPSLAFVMGGAVVVSTIGYRLVFARGKPLFAGTFHLPTASDIDTRLVSGAAIFGVGWGLGGLCPGPAFVVLPQATLTGSLPFFAFFIAMLAGMAAARLMKRGTAERTPA